MGGVRPGRVITGWLVLVGLYTALTNSDRLASAVGLGNSAIRALSDPSRPLIRNHAGNDQGLSNTAGGGGVAQITGSPGGPPAPSDLWRYQSLPSATPPLSYPAPSGGGIVPH